MKAPTQEAVELGAPTLEGEGGDSDRGISDSLSQNQKASAVACTGSFTEGACKFRRVMAELIRPGRGRDGESSRMVSGIPAGLEGPPRRLS